MSAHRDPKTLEDAAVPSTTRRTYESGLRHFRRWGGVLPATIETLRQYLADHAYELAPSTLETRLAAISRLHREGGWPDPSRDPAVQRVMQGIRSQRQHAPEQAEPLLWHELAIVIADIESKIEAYPSSRASQSDSHRAIRDRALFAVGWWGALRASDLAGIRRRHLTRTEYGWKITLFGKADRQKKGEEILLQSGYQPCPHQALDDWMQLIRDPDAPVFPGIRHGSGKILEQPMDVRSIARIISKRTKDAGLTRSYSSHSLRRGWGVSLAASLTLGEFLQRGRWKSADVAARYQMHSKQYFEQQGWRPLIASGQLQATPEGSRLEMKKSKCKSP